MASAGFLLSLQNFSKDTINDEVSVAIMRYNDCQYFQSPFKNKGCQSYDLNTFKAHLRIEALKL